MMVPWIISHIFIRQTKLTLTFVTFCVTFLNFAAKTPFSAQFTLFQTDKIYEMEL